MQAQEIHRKHYSNIPDDVFNQIVSTDTITSNLQNNKIGVYAKWLLSLYKNNNLKLEDLYKAKEYIPIFDKMVKTDKLSNKDINTYKSLPDVYQVIQHYLDNNQSVSKSDETRKIKKEGAEKVYENNYFLVIHPKTKDAAVYYGKGTQWCTSSTESENYFDEYNNRGPLYIVIDKKNNKKYQFHYNTKQFTDETDEEIDFAEHTGLLFIVMKLYSFNKKNTNGNGIIKFNKKYGLIDKNSEEADFSYTTELYPVRKVTKLTDEEKEKINAELSNIIPRGEVEIDLASMTLQNKHGAGYELNYPNGFIELKKLENGYEGLFIQTAQQFKYPLKIQLRAKMDKGDIYIKCAQYNVPIE